MKLVTRTGYKRVTNLALAAVLAVSGVVTALQVGFSAKVSAVSATTVCAPAVGTCTYDNLQTAVNSVADNTVMSLQSDMTLTSELLIKKPLTIRGHGFTLYANFTKNGGNNSVIEVQSTNNVTVKDLTIDGAGGSDLHGINLWYATSVQLNGLTIKNNHRSALVVNSSSAIVDDITTENNSLDPVNGPTGWGAINVDYRNADESRLRIKETITQNEAIPLYVDDDTAGLVKIIDVNGHYQAVPNVKEAGDKAYFANPIVPEINVIAPTCETPYNQVQFNMQPRVRVVMTDPYIAGSMGALRIQGDNEHIIGGQFINLEAFAGAYGLSDLSQLYGTKTNQAVLNVANGVDLPLGSVTATFVDPATLSCTPESVFVYKGHNSTASNLITGTPGYTSNPDVRISWTPSENTDVDYYWFGTKTNAHHRKVQPTQLDANGNVYYQGTISAGNNPYHYTVTAVNELGIESDPIQTGQIILDTEAPEIAIVSPVQGDVISATSPVTIRGEVTDENRMNSIIRVTGPNGYSIENVRRDGRAAHELNWNTASLADGEYTIFFAARDAAQNRDAGSETSITVRIDREGPAMTFDTPADGSILPGGEALTATGTASDVSGIDRVVLLVTNPAGERVQRYVQRDLVGDDWTISIPAGDLPDGEYRFNVNVYDEFRNVTTVRHTVFVETPASDSDGDVAGATDDASGDGGTTTTTTGTDTTEENSSESETNSLITPLTNSPSALFATSAPFTSATTGENAGDNVGSDGDVEGTSVEGVAQVDTDATDGSFWGVAWYWWLLILAALSALVAGIFAASRRNNA